MELRQIIGVALLAGVVGLYVLWLRYHTKQQAAVLGGGIQEITILVKGAYDPNVIKVSSGVLLRIYFNRQEDVNCSRVVLFDRLGIRKELKPFETTTVEIPPQKPGEYAFSCDMGMYQGKLIVT